MNNGYFTKSERNESVTTLDIQAAKDFKKAVTAAKNHRDMFWRSQAPAKNLNEKQILWSACGRPQDDSEGEDIKWLKTSEKTLIQANPEAKARRSYMCFCAPSDVDFFGHIFVSF